MVWTSHALIIVRKTSIAMETLPILVSVYEDMPSAAHHQSGDDLATSVEWPVLAVACLTQRLTDSSGTWCRERQTAATSRSIFCALPL